MTDGPETTPGPPAEPASTPDGPSASQATDPAARVYANALHEAASEQGGPGVGPVREALDDVTSEIVGTPGLARVLFSPRFDAATKRRVLDQLTKDAPPAVVNLLRVLLDNGRLGLLAGVTAAYDQLAARDEHIVEVEAIAAIALPPDVLASLERTLSERTGQTVNLRPRQDPDLVGGLVLRVGDRVVDLSLRHRFDDLRATLARG